MLAKFINQNNLVEPVGENGSLFASEFLILSKKSKASESFLNEFSIKLILFLFRNGKIQCEDENEPWSHDNHTGFVCMSKILGFSYHKKFFYSEWYRRLHPRDLIFYNYIRGGIWKYAMIPFLPLLSIILIESCRLTYKNIDGDKVPSTDGILLTWLRLNAVSMPITEKICTKLVVKNYGSWKNVFRIYFKDPNHINNNFMDEAYERFLK